MATVSLTSAQISPGDLSAAHASLEGVTNCTSCHVLGKTATNQKCLGCHDELGTRATAAKGFHASLLGRQCSECHKEHRGRGFDLVRLDTRSFGHRQTGFSLEGKHRTLECRKCHSSAYIRATDVKRNPRLLNAGTYLGLSAECLACHDDQHGGQLASQCEQCHSEDGWKPASRFVHDRAKFRLAGKHLHLACERCHEERLNNGRHTMTFVGLSFSQCSSCHHDPHVGKFRRPCESCHSDRGWENGVVQTFDHATTRFKLRGKHQTIRCDKCHPTRSVGMSGKVVQRFTTRAYQRCADCHADAHGGEFASRPDKGACDACHTEEGFAPSRFSHASAQFDLDGRHRQTSCEKCHTSLVQNGRKSTVVDFRLKRFQKCSYCHVESHGGQFSKRKDGGDCAACHRTDGFTPSTFTVVDHAQTAFQLTGSHAAVRCDKCHVTEVARGVRTRQFLWERGVRCASCHNDVHGRQFVRSTDRGCESCHSTQAWRALVFSHDRTRFPLSGRHAALDCDQCHKSVDKTTGRLVRQYVDTPTRCTGCHGKSGSTASLKG
jgi:hypothetical protein